MPPYQELNDHFENLLKKTSVFVRAAFHIHSPDSHDWPNSDNTELNNKASFLEKNGEQAFLDELSKELDIVCITDHMKSGYACRLALAAQCRDDITVFPGMEVNCVLGNGFNECIHLLVVFPPDKGVTAIDRIFAENPITEEPDRNGHEQYTLTTSLKDWAKVIQNNGGMLLIAHVDETSRGHRARFRAMRDATLRMFVTDDNEVTIDDQRTISEQYKSIISNCGASAIEIMKSEDHSHYINLTTSDGKPFTMPCVVRSDFHSLEELSSADYKTYVKVSRLGFDCVQDALSFYETRVRFSLDLPEVPSTRIIGLRLRSPSNKGLFREAIIAFNENLNSLIGPRGCGKSTIVEAFRYVLGQNPILKKLQQNNKQEVSYSDLALGIQKANLTDTIIEVIYQNANGDRHLLKATYDDKSDFTTEVLTLDGDIIPISQDAIERSYPVRIYSWSEIENLGRRIELQRALIDRFIAEIPELLERRASLYRVLSTNRNLVTAKCNELLARLEEDGGLLRRYSEFQADFERINTDEVASLFNDLDQAREKRSVLIELRSEFEELKNYLENMKSVDLAQIQEVHLSQFSETVQNWCNEEIIGLLDLSDIAQNIDSFKSQMVEIIDEKIAALQEKLHTQESEINEDERVLREQIHASPEEELIANRREQTKRRLDSASDKRDQYNALFSELEDLLSQRNTTLDEIEEIQTTISNERSSSRDSLMEMLTELNIGDMRISITFGAGKDRKNAIEFMRDGDFLSGKKFGQYKRTHFAERCSNMANPVRIARAILEKQTAILEEEGLSLDTDESLAIDEADAMIDVFHPFEHDADADVRFVNINQLTLLMQLQERHWDDELRILLDDRPVDGLSPGQRSSAMLPLVALAERIPLIIDQPEDNLDNRMVGKTLTGVLASLKEKRQIIVATHNPNIVVGGDSEQVIVLDAQEARSAEVTDSGSIDDENIIKSVIGIMEGGKEAFQTRERRYQRLLEGA